MVFVLPIREKLFTMSTKRKDQYQDTIPSKKTKIELNGTIDLTYPFWTDTVTPTLTPPMLGGPLFDDNGFLNVRTTSPIFVKDHSIILAYDTSLTKDGGSLSVHTDSEGPITNDGNGLTINATNGIEIDEFGYLVVKTHDGPIYTDESGVYLNFNNDVFESTQNSNNMNELQLKLAQDGGLSIENGLGVKCDSTLTTDQEGLGVVINEESPLTADENGLDIEYDNTLTVNNDNNIYKLGVNVSQNGAIENNNGLSIKIDTSQFEIRSNTLLLKSPTTQYEFTSGQADLEKFTAYVSTYIEDVQYKILCSYYAVIKNSFNICHGILTIRVLSFDAGNVGIPDKTVDPSLTFWLCRDFENENSVNFSMCYNNTFSPGDSSLVKTAITPTYYNSAVDVSEKNFYVGDSIAHQTLNGTPVGKGQLADRYNYSTNFYIVHPNNFNVSKQLVFTINLKPTGRGITTKYLFDPFTNGEVIIGPIPFWYYGTKV